MGPKRCQINFVLFPGYGKVTKVRNTVTQQDMTSEESGCRLFSDINCMFNSPKSAYLVGCSQVFLKDTITGSAISRYHEAALRSVIALSTSES